MAASHAIHEEGSGDHIHQRKIADGHFGRMSGKDDRRGAAALRQPPVAGTSRTDRRHRRAMLEDGIARAHAGG